MYAPSAFAFVKGPASIAENAGAVELAGAKIEVAADRSAAIVPGANP